MKMLTKGTRKGMAMAAFALALPLTSCAKSNEVSCHIDAPKNFPSLDSEEREIAKREWAVSYYLPWTWPWVQGTKEMKPHETWVTFDAAGIMEDRKIQEAFFNYHRIAVEQRYADPEINKLIAKTVAYMTALKGYNPRSESMTIPTYFCALAEMAEKAESKEEFDAAVTVASQRLILTIEPLLKFKHDMRYK